MPRHFRRSPGPGPASLVRCLGLVLVLGVVAFGVSAPSRSAGLVLRKPVRATSREFGPSRLSSLPVSAQSVISATVGSGARGFAATRQGHGWRLAGGGLSARLGRGGVMVRSAAGGVSLRLSGIGRGPDLVAINGWRSIEGRGDRVVYRRPGLREWFTAGPLGIEQGFTVARRPARARGTVTVALGLGGSLRAVGGGSQVRFVTPAGGVGVRYGGLSATDATGARLPARLVLDGGRRLLLRIDDRGARYPLRIDPFVQQGAKLTGGGETGNGDFGLRVALSSDGSTALVGGYQDNGGVGAAWVFTRTNGVWAQQAMLTCASAACDKFGYPEVGNALFGSSVALSADGNTALIGGDQDNGGQGAVWVFNRFGSGWDVDQKLVACTTSCGVNGGEVGTGAFGFSVALSADGSTALIGGDQDNNQAGAAWVFTVSNFNWSQQGPKLVGDCTATPCTGPNGTGEVAESNGIGGQLGHSVALSGDGNTALIGANNDATAVGAAWVFTRSGSGWSQQGPKLVGAGEVGAAEFGFNVALSAAGNTALIGGGSDNSDEGAAWVFTRSGSAWSQQGAKLVGDCTATTCTGPNGTGETGGAGFFGDGGALSGDGNTALIGGLFDNNGLGAAWVFTRSGSTWSQQGAKLVGDCTVKPCTGPNGTGEVGNGDFGWSVALSSDGSTALIGALGDNGGVGAAWPFAVQSATATSTTTALSSSQNPSKVAQAITFTATIKPAPDGGGVNFIDNGATICEAVPVTAGQATCQTTPGAAGTYPVIATYAGDAGYRGSTSPTLDQMVAGTATTTTLTSSVNPAEVGQAVTYTAMVTPAPDGGTVSFADGQAAIPGCGRVGVTAGTAMCTTTYQAPGVHSIIATYSGDAAYGASDTNSLTETVVTTTAQGRCSSLGSGRTGGTATAEISSVTPLGNAGVGKAFGLLLTPQFLGPGAQVMISGVGLCPGSKVEFGNRMATVTPTAVAADGASLVATIPKYATSGAVTVHTPTGDLVAPQTLPIDNFRDTWGWSFTNYGLPAPDASLGTETTLFGADAVYEHLSIFGFPTSILTDVPSPGALLWLSQQQPLVGQGVCFGMASLIQWLSHQSAPQGIDRQLGGYPNTGLTPYLLDGPTGPSASLDGMIAVFHLDQDTAQYDNYVNTELDESKPISPTRAVDAVTRALQSSSGRDLPVMNLFNQGPGGGGHAVVAYGVESNGSGGYYIDVYNPNTPYTPGETTDTTGAAHQTAVDDSRILVNADGSWTFGDGFNPAWHGDKYHLFVARKQDVPDPFSSDAAARPQFPSDAVNAGVGSVGSSAAMTQVTDASGHTLINADGSQNVAPARRISHASLVFPLTGGLNGGAPTALLPPGGSYEVTEHGNHAGAYTDFLTGAGLDGLVGSRTQPSVSDRIGVDPKSARISFTSGSIRGKPVTFEMVSGHQPERTATLTSTSFEGGHDAFVFRGDSIDYSHTGPATTVELQFSSVGAGGLPVAFRSGAIRIGPGQGATFTPTSWHSLSAVTARITGSGRTTSLVLHSTLRPLAALRRLSLAVSRGSGRTRVLTISTRVGRIPAGAQLELTWIVRRGTHIAARHMLTLSGGHLRRGRDRERFNFKAPRAGSYRFTALATLVVIHGVTEQARDTTKTISLRVR